MIEIFKKSYELSGVEVEIHCFYDFDVLLIMSKELYNVNKTRKKTVKVQIINQKDYF